MHRFYEAEGLGSAGHTALLLASTLLREILLSKLSTRGFGRAWVVGWVCDFPNARKL